MLFVVLLGTWGLSTSKGDDGVPPTCVSASGINTFDKILFTFSEPMDPNTAGDPWNYEVNGGTLLVTAAELVGDGSQVRLTTDPQTPGAVLTVTVRDATDVAGNPLQSDECTLSVANFIFTVTTATDEDDGGPWGGSGVSLREAIKYSQAGDLIQFWDRLNGQTITLELGELVIDKDLTIEGPGANLLAISGNNDSRVLSITGQTVTIANLTISGGTAGQGGGIYSISSALTVNNCTVSGNSAGTYGGGIYSYDGTLTVQNCTVSGNSASFYGGGIFADAGTLTVNNSTASGNSAGLDGGGIYCIFSALTVNDCTVSGNSVRFYSGGGLYSYAGTLTVNNSTVSGNSASLYGGGILSYGGTLTVNNCTVSGNSADAYGGIYSESGTLIMKNSIVAGNTAGVVSRPDISPYGSIISNGHNLVGNGDDVPGLQPGDLVGTTVTPRDPKLGPLANNGGPTLTHALLADSPAVDAGNNADSPGPADQRGYIRIINGNIDIGAFEAQSVVTSTTTVVDSAARQYSDTVTLSASVSPDTATGSVQFSVNGAAVGGPVVVTGGQAAVIYTISLAASSIPYQVHAAFTSATPDSFTDSEGASTLEVTKEDADLTPAAGNPSAVKVNTAGGNAGPIVLNATISEWQNGPGQVNGTSDDLGDVCKAAPVTVQLNAVVGGGSLSVPAAAVLSCDGATLQVQATFNDVPVNVYEVSFVIGGDHYRGSASSALVVYDPSLGFVTGGGKIDRGDGVWGEFAGNVKYLKKGVQGGVLYIEHWPEGDLKVKSNSMQTLAIVGDSAVITAKATVAGVGNYQVQAVLVDHGEPGVGADQFGFKVWTPGGALVNDLTFSPLTLVEGNIQVPHPTIRK